MQFVFETKTKGFIAVDADIVNGELKVVAPLAQDLGKREAQDLLSVARTLLGTVGKFEDGKKDIRNYK